MSKNTATSSSAKLLRLAFYFHLNAKPFSNSILPYFQDAIIDLCEDDDVNIRKQAIKVWTFRFRSTSYLIFLFDLNVEVR